MGKNCKFRKTKNSHHWQLLDKLKKVYRNKRRNRPIRDAILQLDPNTVNLTAAKLMEMHWGTL